MAHDMKLQPHPTSKNQSHPNHLIVTILGQLEISSEISVRKILDMSCLVEVH